VTENGEPVILQNPATEKNHYAVIFGITQLIDNKERARRVHQTIITSINKVSARESTTSQHAFDDEISEIENTKKKKRKSKEKNSVEEVKKKNLKKELEKKSRRIIKRKTEFSAKSKRKIIKQESKTESSTKNGKIKRKIDLTLESDIELSTDEKESSGQLSLPTISDADRIVTVLLQVFADVRKDHLRLFSLAKTVITSDLAKADRKEVVKTLNIIRESADDTIIQIVEKYSSLAFLNSTLEDFAKTKDSLPHTRFYVHDKNLDVFLKEESYILKKHSASPISR